ncbi:2-hydroxyacid dehydrogenase [Pandoraea terrae]
MPRVLVTRRFVTPLPAMLTQSCVVDINDRHEALDAAALHARLRGCHGVLVGAGDRVDAGWLAAAPSLRVVSTASMGFNHIDVAACTRAGVLVTNTPDVVVDATADLGWLLIMAAARRLGASERWLRSGAWPGRGWRFDDWLGADVSGTTLGIVGMGRIGQAIARRAAGFRMRVCYHNRKPLPDAQAAGAQYVSLEALLREADHVIVVVPYSPATHHLIGARELARMKPGATLVNIARGGVVDDGAIAEALRAGRPGAAGLDVYEGEPEVHPELLALENVVLAPHIGTATVATRSTMFSLAVRNLLDAMQGRRPAHLVNPEVLATERIGDP